MNRFKGRRARLANLLTIALCALAIFVLPGLASARHGSDDGSGSTATIKSFDPATKTLVISLPDAQTLSGTVTRKTKIRCEDQRGDRRGGHGSRGREAEPGDDHGSGANCAVADLVPGAVVEEVELRFGADGVKFDEVELDDHSSR